MDSGNSASLQSSSGGDDEFDSSRQAESISSFFNPNPRQNPNIFHDPIWSAAGLPPPSNHPHNNHNNLLMNSFPTFGGLNSLPSPSSSLQQIQPQPSDFDGGGGKPPSDHLSAVTKNPKKRTRASRRAPTTVLTTDTANFRQMVQEFTGIPSSPFGAGVSPYSRRLDLFSTPAAALRLGIGGGGGGGHLDTLGPLYSLRPQFPPPTSSSLLNSTMVDSIVPSTNITINPNSADHLLTLQNRDSISINPLQFGGFGHHPSGRTTVRNRNDNNDNDEDDSSRWKSGGGNGDNDGEEEEETAAASGFDGNIDNTRHYQRQHQHQRQHQISGHRRSFSSNSNNNNDILGEKGGLGNGGSSSSPSGPNHQATLAPWIYPSQ